MQPIGHVADQSTRAKKRQGGEYKDSGVVQE